jgi:hypothetical protein
MDGMAVGHWSGLRSDDASTGEQQEERGGQKVPFHRRISSSGG